jgi:hypothetical protein
MVSNMNRAEKFFLLDFPKTPEQVIDGKEPVPDPSPSE